MIDQPLPDDVPMAGFTLLELLVVLSILALLAVIALPALTAPSDGVRLRTTAGDFLAALRLARARAIARNGDVALVIDVDKRSLETPAVASQQFAPDIVVQLKIAEPERTTQSRGAFRFFADGSSTGGDIILRLGGREVRICVDWLTGRAQQGGEC